MSRIIWLIVALAAVGGAFFFGRYTVQTESVQTALEPAPDATPTAPRTAEQRARDLEIHGELKARMMDPEPLSRIRDLSEYLSQLPDSEVPALAQLMTEGAPGLGPVEVAVLIRRWALADPQAAANWVTNDAEIWLTFSALDALLETWGGNDPTAAGAYLASHARFAEGPFLQNAQAGYVRGWYASGKPGLITWIYSLGADVQQQRALTALAESVLQAEGADALMAYMEAFPDFDDRYKRTMHRQGAEVLAKHDPQLAVVWCEKACQGPHGAHALAIVAKIWAQADGPAALAWLGSQPPGDERDRAVKAAFYKWRIKDTDGLTRWVGRQDPDAIEPHMVAAASRAAHLLSWDYPEEAYRWAARIPRASARENVYVAITRRYLEVDEPAAMAWLEQSPLSEEGRARALQPAPNLQTRGDRPYPPVVNLLAPESGSGEG